MKYLTDFLIATPITEEWQAFITVLENPEEPPHHTILPTMTGKIAGHDVVCVKTGKGNSSIAAALTDVMSNWRPRYVILTGVAGGITAKKGDVVVASFVYGLDYGKLENGHLEHRPELDFGPDLSLLSYAETIAEGAEQTWQTLIPLNRPDKKPKTSTRAHIGRIGSSDKVIDDFTSPMAQALLGSTVGLHACEMEGTGAGAAIHYRQTDFLVGFLIVRGISDTVKQSSGQNAGKRQRKLWKPYAAGAAAAFVRKLLSVIKTPIRTESPGSNINRTPDMRTASMGEDRLSSCVKVTASASFHGSGAWDGKDELILLVDNESFDPISISAVEARWRPKDDRVVEGFPQIDPKVTPPVIVPIKGTEKFTFWITGEQVQHAGVTAAVYPSVDDGSYPRLHHLVFEFLIMFAGPSSSTIIKTLSFTYPPHTVIAKERHNANGILEEDVAAATRFHEEYQEAQKLEDSQDLLAIEKYYSALKLVQGFWDDNTELHKRIARTRLWRLLVENSFEWFTNLEIIHPENIERARDLYSSDGEFIRNCLRLHPSRNAFDALAAGLFCWSEGMRQTDRIQKRDWLRKAKDHATIARGTFKQQSFKSEFQQTYFVTASQRLMDKVDVELSAP